MDIKIGATAPKAAAEIHTDFEKGFIRAKVVGYDDFINNKRLERFSRIWNNEIRRKRIYC